jgi:NAD(P)H-dependent flavin oxidoreductase YrpB (nitropropane dioxygenase family)
VRTPICDRLGIELPIFAFSHCRDVIAAVSKAGGYGVLGALAYSPDQLEIELTWIDEHVEGRPYGVDFAMPAKYVGKGGGAEASLGHLHELIPPEHQAFVEGLLAEHGVPPLPEEVEVGVVKAAGLGDGEERPGQVEVAPSHPVSMVVNALGPPPPYVVEQAHERGILVGGLVGNRQHAERQVAQGTDVIVAQGTEAGGHCGDVSTMVLVPEVVDAVGPDVPVLAAGGIGAAGRWPALRSVRRGVDRFHLAHRGRGRHQPVARGRCWRQLARHRALAFTTGKPAASCTARTDAWERGTRPEPLPMPAGIVFSEAQRRVSAPRAGSSRGSPSARSSGA